MATIGSLLINLTTNSATFAAGMAKNASAVMKFASDIGAAGLQVAKFGAGVVALGATAAAGGLMVLTKQAMETIDATAKTSDQLGIQTEKLIGLRHAADLAGVSNEDFDKSMGQLTKRLGEAAMNGGPVETTLQGIGLSARNLAAMAPDEAFYAIADGIAGISNPAQRAAVAFDLFGKQGISMISVLSGGSAALKEAQADAEKLGLTFSRVDAAQVEAANDAMTRLGALFTGIGQQLAIQVAPFITAAVDKLTEMGAAGLNSGELVTSAFEWVVGAVAKAADYLALFSAGWYGLKAAVDMAAAGILIAIDKAGAAIVKLLNLLPGVNLEWTSTFSEMADGMIAIAQEEADKFHQAMNTFSTGANSAAAAKFFADLRGEARAAATEVANAAKVTEHAIDTQVQANVAEAERIDALKKAAEKVIEDSRTPLQEFSAKMADLQDMAQMGFINSDVLAAATKKAQEAFLKDSNFEQFQTQLGSQRLAAMDAGFLTRAPATDRTAEVQQQQKMLQQQMAAALLSIDSKTGVDVSVPWN